MMPDYEWIKSVPIKKIENVTNRYQLDPVLIAAVVQVESRGESFAIRFEPNYQWLSEPQRWAKLNSITLQTEITAQKISWGLMQIMGATARDLSFESYLSELVVDEINLDLGCRYFKRQLSRYNSNITDAIAAYNAGEAIIVDGDYKNAEYVERVLSFYKG